MVKGKFLLIIGLLLVLFLCSGVSAFKPRVYFDKGVDEAVYIPVLDKVNDCGVRVDIVSRNNVFFNGFAWYSGRVVVFDGNGLGVDMKRYVLAHEIGHICASNNRLGTYDDREGIANNYAMRIGYGLPS
jgi:hypothetical protein